MACNLYELLTLLLQAVHRQHSLRASVIFFPRSVRWAKWRRHLGSGQPPLNALRGFANNWWEAAHERP